MTEPLKKCPQCGEPGFGTVVECENCGHTAEAPSVDVDAILKVAENLASLCDTDYHRSLISISQDFVSKTPFTPTFGCFCSQAAALRKACNAS